MNNPVNNSKRILGSNKSRCVREQSDTECLVSAMNEIKAMKVEYM